MEKVNYLGQPDCYRLSNGTVELVVTTNVGPRILRYAFAGGENILGEVPESTVQTELGEWRPLGGHRLWTAPEASPRGAHVGRLTTAPRPVPVMQPTSTHPHPT